MPTTEAQKQAQKRYAEKNRERIALYKKEHWQANKHRWTLSGGSVAGERIKPPVTDARKQSQQRYVQENKERIAAYKKAYWQANKHRWTRSQAAEPQLA